LPGDTQRRARALFPSVLTASRLEAWTPTDFAPVDSALVIAAAPWSPNELRLLDLLNAPSTSAAHPVRLVVFDVDSCPPDELTRRIPSRDRPLMTPVVGWWKNGRLVESTCGYAARHLIYRVLGLDPRPADEYVLQRPAGAAV
jgi:hypothetical protein